MIWIELWPGFVSVTRTKYLRKLCIDWIFIVQQSARKGSTIFSCAVTTIRSRQIKPWLFRKWRCNNINWAANGWIANYSRTRTSLNLNKFCTSEQIRKIQPINIMVFRIILRNSIYWNWNSSLIESTNT